MQRKLNSERRSYFRLTLEKPLCAKMTIALINGEYVNTGNTKICVLDIGPGGLKYLSALNMPQDPHITLGFLTTISNEMIYLHGTIARRIEVQDGIYEYGIQFLITEERRDEIIKLINVLAVGQRNKWNISHSSLCPVEDKIACLSQKNNDESNN